MSSLNFTLISLTRARMIIYLFLLAFIYLFIHLFKKKKKKAPAEKYLTLRASLMTRRGAAFCWASLILLLRSCASGAEQLRVGEPDSEPSPRRATCCMPYIEQPGGERSVRGIWAQEPQAVFDALFPPLFFFSPPLPDTRARTNAHGRTAVRRFTLNLTCVFVTQARAQKSHTRARALLFSTRNAQRLIRFYSN